MRCCVSHRIEREADKQIEEHRKAEHVRRARAVISLKQNTEAAHAELASANEKRFVCSNRYNELERS